MNQIVAARRHDDDSKHVLGLGGQAIAEVLFMLQRIASGDHAGSLN